MGAIFALLTPLAAAAGEPAEYRAGLHAFRTEMMRSAQFPRNNFAALLDHATYRQEIIDAIRTPYEAKPWHLYRNLFVTAERATGGAEFWRANVESLERAELRYGIPAQIIVAILGVETKYGGNVGNYPVIDALSTLAFAYPPRSDFFRQELKQFLLLTRDEALDAGDVTGSYAGAVGKPQFIPSSYRTYAVDFDGDGRRDLWNSDADVIGSVANYLAQHGWRVGEPVAVRAQVSGVLPADLPVTDGAPLQPSIDPSALRAAGVTTAEHSPASAAVTLIRLAAPEVEYWLGFDNFYAITQYNHSNLYAMAVYQLSQEIKRLHEEPGRQRVVRN
jgi:membrane-bound lytic murein transglycosylase B